MKKIYELILKLYKENPGRFFGLLFPYILVIIIAIGFLYLGKVEVISRNSVPPVIADSVITADLSIAEVSETEPINIETASKTDAGIISKGKALFTANCVSCHGADGNGDGAAGAALNPKPRNFHATDGWKNGRKISEMYKTLQEGIKGSGMSAYDYLPPADRFALIHYVRSFMTQPPTDTPAELAQLDNVYSLSKGAKFGGQIPVRMAEKIMLAEDMNKMKEITAVVNKINADTNAAAKILKSVSVNKSKIVKTVLFSDILRQESSEFAKSTAANIPFNGFSNAFNRLSPEDLNTVYVYLKSFVKD